MPLLLWSWRWRRSGKPHNKLRLHWARLSWNSSHRTSLLSLLTYDKLWLAMELNLVKCLVHVIGRPKQYYWAALAVINLQAGSYFGLSMRNEERKKSYKKSTLPLGTARLLAGLAPPSPGAAQRGQQPGCFKGTPPGRTGLHRLLQCECPSWCQGN